MLTFFLVSWCIEVGHDLFPHFLQIIEGKCEEQLNLVNFWMLPPQNLLSRFSLTFPGPKSSASIQCVCMSYWHYPIALVYGKDICRMIWHTLAKISMSIHAGFWASLVIFRTPFLCATLIFWLYSGEFATLPFHFCSFSQERAVLHIYMNIDKKGSAKPITYGQLFFHGLCNWVKSLVHLFFFSFYSLSILYISSVVKDEYRLVRDCVSGHIYDSSPVDFTSDLGSRFVLHPTVLKMSQPPRLASWIANGIASSLDALFLSRFESQRAEYWQTLYASVVSTDAMQKLCFPFLLAIHCCYSYAEHGCTISDFVFRRWWSCSLSNNLQFCTKTTRPWCSCQAGEME